MSRRGILSDPFRFAIEGRSLQATLPLGELVRLTDVLFDDRGEVVFSLSGEIHADGKPYFRLVASAPLGLQCQRCLDRLDWQLDLESVLQLVKPGAPIPDEELEIEAFDAIEGVPDFDAYALLEDEILLALPLVPRHVSCEAPRPEGVVKKESPFAALATLRKNSGAQ